MIGDDLRERVLAWIAEDPDERDRAELTALLAAGESDSVAAAGLADRFSGRLSFGTAGLRGAIGAGPCRMNRAVVRATTAALARWLLTARTGSTRCGVVIGWDARHRSEDLAEETARVLAGAEIPVLLAGCQPTPLVAFAIRHLGAAAGVMITASHNPPGDNGYKLYASDGAQIIAPADIEIEALAHEVGPLSAVPLAAPDSPLITRIGDEVATAYLDAVCAMSPAPAEAAWLRFVYTPLHGVAGALALRAFTGAGFPEPDVVAAQAAPDPDFPTVAFPNPELPGVLNLALTQARRSGADLVLANDPDGDRLAVAVPDEAASGGWRQLTGDQVGALLGADLLARYPVGGDRPLVVTTIVSSSLLAGIAAAAGADYAETLTGFKWIVRAGQSRRGTRFVYGYEEALGYAVGSVVRDKDGIGTALAVLKVAARARACGRTLQDEYDALEVEHGVHLTAQVTAPVRTAAEFMARLRAGYPAELGGAPVRTAEDLTGGTAELPSADVLIYRLDGARVVIRPSGTEPKVKAYLEVVEPVPGGLADLSAARRRAKTRMDPLREAVRDLLG